MEDSDLVVELDEKFHPKTDEGAELISDILLDIDGIDFEEEGFDGEFFIVSTDQWEFRIQPQVGVVVAIDKTQENPPRYSYQYMSLNGALGWILCKAGFGSNISRYEAFSTSLEAEGEFNGIYSAMEVKPSREGERYYKQILKNAKEAVLSQSGGATEDLLLGTGTPTTGDDVLGALKSDSTEDDDE